MLDFELEELNQSTDWRDVLSAYLDAHQAAHAAAKNTEEGFDGWLPRIMAVEGIETEDLPRIHGKLIALGFLKFQLASRGTGVVYQISPAGRQALNNILPDESESEDDEESHILQDGLEDIPAEDIPQSEQPVLESDPEEGIEQSVLETAQVEVISPSEESALEDEEAAATEDPSQREEDEVSQPENLPETMEVEQSSEADVDEVPSQVEEEIEASDKAA